MNINAFEKNKRVLRKKLPFPKIWARLSRSRIPTAYVTGKKSQLYTPESISFNPTGELIAVCNAGNDSISFYNKSSSGTFKNTPCLVLSDPEILQYVHDSAFSPCGNYLVAVGERSQSLIMYSIHKTHEHIDAKLMWSVKGEHYKLGYPAGIAFHPSGEWIGVANRSKNGITIYRKDCRKGQFDTTPAHILSEDYLAKYNLSAPHGLTFSPDGNFLIITHKRFFRTGQGDDKKSSISIFKWSSDKGLENSPSPLFIHRYINQNPALHLVTYHPSENIIAVSYSFAGADVYRWNPEKNELVKTDSIEIFKIRTGAKGISFTKDGQQLVLTTDLGEILFFNYKK